MHASFLWKRRWQDRSWARSQEGPSLMDSCWTWYNPEDDTWLSRWRCVGLQTQCGSVPNRGDGIRWIKTSVVEARAEKWSTIGQILPFIDLELQFSRCVKKSVWTPPYHFQRSCIIETARSSIQQGIYLSLEMCSMRCRHIRYVPLQTTEERTFALRGYPCMWDAQEWQGQIWYTFEYFDSLSDSLNTFSGTRKRSLLHTQHFRPVRHPSKEETF